MSESSGCYFESLEIINCLEYTHNLRFMKFVPDYEELLHFIVYLNLKKEIVDGNCSIIGINFYNFNEMNPTIFPLSKLN